MVTPMRLEERFLRRERRGQRVGLVLGNGDKLEATLQDLDDDAIQVQEYGTNRVYLVYRRAIAAIWFDDIATEPGTGSAIADVGPDPDQLIEGAGGSPRPPELGRGG